MTTLRIIPGKRLFHTPPGGWNEVEPITKQKAHGDNFAGLVDDELRLLKLNKKPIPKDIGLQIEARFAAKLPDSWVYDPDAPPNRPLPNRAGRTIVLRNAVDQRTTKILKAWNDAGRPKLDIATAEERAAICLKCPKHAPMGCLTCDGTYQDLQARMGKDLAVRTKIVVGGKTMRVDELLQACGVDQVFNKVQIWLPDEVVKDLLPKIGRIKVEAYPDTCWKKKIMQSMQPAATVAPAAPAPEPAPQAAPVETAPTPPPPKTETMLEVRPDGLRVITMMKETVKVQVPKADGDSQPRTATIIKAVAPKAKKPCRKCGKKK